MPLENTIPLAIQREMLDNQIKAQRYHIKSWREQIADVLENTVANDAGHVDIQLLENNIRRAEQAIDGLIRRQLAIDSLMSPSGPRVA